MLVPKSDGRKETNMKCKAIDQNNAKHCVHWGKIYIFKFISFVAVKRKKNDLNVQRHKNTFKTLADTVFISRF